MGMIKFLVCVEKPMRHAYMLAILIFLLPYNIISQNNIIDFYEIGWRDNYILKKAENKKDSNDLKEAIINYETVLNHYSLNIRANFGIAESYNLLKNKEDIAVIYYMKTYEYASKAILECDKRKNRSNKAEKLQATFREYRDSSRNKIEHIKDKQKYLDQENKTSIKVIEAEKDIINNELVTSVLIAAEEYSGSTKNIIKNKKASEVYYNKFNFVNSEIVSGQNNGELFEPQKQGYESNVINNNMLNTDFIKINAFNPIDQLDEIRKEVCKNIDSLPLLNYSEIEQTNQKWSENNSLKNYSWFNDLTNAQDKYLNVIKIINDTYIVINKMNNDINETVQDIEILKTKIQLSKNELSTLSTSTINDINTEYKSRLATIPQSVVLVARIDLKKYDKNERTIVEKYFDRKINRRAINIIKGTNIVTRILSENGEIFEEYFKTIIGRAQTVDTYYQDKIVYTPKNDWEYKILRMEVFPFEEVNIVNTDKVLDNDTYDSKNIQIYEVELDSVENVLLFDENKKLTKANGLGERVNTYIVKKMLYSSDINTLYSDRYNEARRKYEQKIQEIEPIKKILNFEIDSLKKELDTNQLILEKTQRDLVNIRDVNLFDMYENYEKIKNEYYSIYNNKHTIVNKLITQGPKNSNNRKEMLEDMVFSTFIVIGDIKNTTYEYKIYKDMNNGNNKIQTIEKTISLIPKLEAFEIISIGLYEKDSTEGENGLILNIAYDLSWNPIKDWIIVDTTNNIVHDTNTGILWKMFSYSYSSYIRYLQSDKNDKNEWELPSFDELISFFQNGSEQRKSSNFIEKMNLPINDRYLTRDIIKHNNREYHKVLFINRNYMIGDQDKYVTQGDRVYILTKSVIKK